MSESTSPQGPLSSEELRRLDARWRAANNLSVGEIYLLDNALARAVGARARQAEAARPLGTAPGLNLLHTHMNRTIVQRDLSACT